MRALRRDDVVRILRGLARLMEEHKQHLTELDAALGDGDLGLTMPRAFGAAYEEAAGSEEADVGKVLMRAGIAMARAAPSTMGTLVATGFMRGGKAVAGLDELTTGGLAAFFQAFVAGVMERGKAQPGEKTIIDSLKPAADALSAAGSADLDRSLAAALEAAEAGLDAARDMVAKHGRPAYYGEQSRGRQDPGATVGVLIVSGFLGGAGEASGPRQRLRER
jgi:dihydroxyacetone kinase-like protein